MGLRFLCMILFPIGRIGLSLAWLPVYCITPFDERLWEFYPSKDNKRKRYLFQIPVLVSPSHDHHLGASSISISQNKPTSASPVEQHSAGRHDLVHKVEVTNVSRQDDVSLLQCVQVNRRIVQRGNLLSRLKSAKPEDQP